MTIAMTEFIDLYYEVAGSGPELVFIGPAGTDLRTGPNPIDSPLVSEFTVAAYDQRALGESSVPDGPYEMADYLTDAIDLLDDIGWSSAHIVGEDFGGMIAQELAIRCPERVDRLVLCATSARGLLADADLSESIELRSPEQGRSGEHSGADWQCVARRDHDTTDRLDQISATVLVCAGREDADAGASAQAELTAAIPDNRLRWFDGGHDFLHIDPAAWSEIIDFLLE
jgi:3-oxoadipate enol-lactonase